MYYSLPAAGYKIRAFHIGFLTKNALSKNPMPPIRVPPPPFSSISFLLTAHARILPPLPVARVEGGGGGLGEVLARSWRGLGEVLARSWRGLGERRVARSWVLGLWSWLLHGDLGFD